MMSAKKIVVLYPVELSHPDNSLFRIEEFSNLVDAYSRAESLCLTGNFKRVRVLTETASFVLEKKAIME